ncbi:type II secretion system minor pseudopilin GspK, partial [Aeromonas cavernicola]
EPVSSLGAEDAHYEGLKPPYLTANQLMLDKDELRAVRGVTAKIYARLAPYVCVVPNNKLKININTLDPTRPALLSALYLGKIGTDEAKRVLTERPQKGWQEKKAMTVQMPVQASTIPGLEDSLVVSSDYFNAQLIAEVGDTRARLQTIFMRSSENKLVVLRRLNDGAE